MDCSYYGDSYADGLLWLQKYPFGHLSRGYIAGMLALYTLTTFALSCVLMFAMKSHGKTHRRIFGLVATLATFAIM